jgi:inosine-uridine nucleoside N-ribohydrolase
MGGAFRVPGNTGPVGEFNYYVDPEAAHLVLNAALPVTVVPLDVTQQLVLMQSELEYRAARRANRLSRAITRFTRAYMQYHRKVEGFHGGYLHDPLAVAATIDPLVIQTQRLHVDVECGGQFTRGMTVADLRRKVRKEEAAVDVALRVDRTRFFKLFHERVWG